MIRRVARVAAIVGPMGLVGLGASSRAYAQSPPAASDTIAVGDWQLAPRIEVRTRGEYRRDPPDMGGISAAGDVGPRVRNAYGVLERSRLGLGAEHGALAVQVTLQDARAWGAPSPTGVLGGQASGLASFGAYEAWFEAHTSSAHPSFLRVGRQAITWGDGRLVANADGSPTARTLDAIRGRLALGVVDLEAFAAMLETPRPLGASAGDAVGTLTSGTQLYGAQVAVAVDPLLKLELSLLARVARSEAGDGSGFSLGRADGETYVGDLRVHGDSRGWRYAAEGAYELGRATLLGDASISAWAAAAYVEKRLDAVVLSPTLRLEADYASGDDGSATYRQFDPLLPDVHPLHGAMDVFAWSNTVQASARVAVVPWQEGRAAVEYRYARLANDRGAWLDAYLGEVGRGQGSAGGTELGHEVDAWASWRPWPALDLAAGYSLLALGDGARAVMAAKLRGGVQADGSIEAASFAHFAYLQATLRAP